MKHIKTFEKLKEPLEYCKIIIDEPYFSASLKKIVIEEQKDYLLQMKVLYRHLHIYR